MNVAEDVGDAGFVELDKLSASALVQAKIETLSVKEREDVMEKRIMIRELHLPARWNHQQGRVKGLILLD
jgi:hypothetical protein